MPLNRTITQNAAVASRKLKSFPKPYPGMQMVGFQWRYDYSCHHCLFPAGCYFCLWFLTTGNSPVWHHPKPIPSELRMQQKCSVNGQQLISGYITWTQLSTLVEMYSISSVVASTFVVFFLSYLTCAGWPEAALCASGYFHRFWTCEGLVPAKLWHSLQYTIIMPRYDFIVQNKQQLFICKLILTLFI